jgi:putative transposase
MESYNRQLRKVTKAKSIFPNDEALLKSLYLATVDITQKWTHSIRSWAQILAQLSIFFQGRLDNQLF